MLIEPAQPDDLFRARTRDLVILFPLLAALGAAASDASAQTSVPASPPTTQATSATYAPSEAPPGSRHAHVAYANGLLTVAANNASLNQILREISRQTGMKITGGVTDDHVFGTYGPAAPSAVLATLLDGTGSNLLIVQNGLETPGQLILTPRIGGVTPPNPNASAYDDSDSSAENASPPIRSAPPPPPPTRDNSRTPNRAGTGGVDLNPAATSPSSTSQQIAFPPVDQSTPPSTATTTPLSPDAPPDAVKTPQQIFEQLQRLRQQQTQPSNPQ